MRQGEEERGGWDTEELPNSILNPTPSSRPSPPKPQTNNPNPNPPPGGDLVGGRVEVAGDHGLQVLVGHRRLQGAQGRREGLPPHRPWGRVRDKFTTKEGDKWMRKGARKRGQKRYIVRNTRF